jgi:hypothetical protein
MITGVAMGVTVVMLPFGILTGLAGAGLFGAAVLPSPETR